MIIGVNLAEIKQRSRRRSNPRATAAGKANREPAARMKKKIPATLARVWGEGAATSEPADRYASAGSPAEHLDGSNGVSRVLLAAGFFHVSGVPEMLDVLVVSQRAVDQVTEELLC